MGMITSPTPCVSATSHGPVAFCAYIVVESERL